MQGEALGPYVIELKLGSGGMGTVYAARVEREVAGLSPGTRVALKIVHGHLLKTEGFFKRFLLEAQIGKSVTHRNVVRTLDCDAIAGHHFLVMEYVDGQTLRELCDQLGSLPEELCRHVGREVCAGLSAIHAVGVVHRDLKPENVLITPDHQVKVMDLGIAKLADEVIRLSQTGAFIGSVEYGAPEQFSSGHAEPRTDLHALGVLLYELAADKHPYRGDDFRAVMQRICHESPRRLGQLCPQISPFFEELVHTLLAKSVDERFASADIVATLLAEGEDSAWWRQRASEIRAQTRRPLRRVRVPRETAVYGRDVELAQLRAEFDQAFEGDGRVVLVSGEAGIGKSRLVDELCSRLEQDRVDFHFLHGGYPPGGAATASGAFSTAYREQLGDDGSAAYLSRTPGLVPAFDALLRGDPHPKGVEPLTKDTLQTCFVRTTRGLAIERPVVVLIEDLHFAPDEALALFSALAHSIAGQAVLLIGTTRPEISRQWVAELTRLRYASQLALLRLGPKDLIHLLRDSLRSERSANQLAAQIAVKSDGNPFFVFEIVRGLRDGNFLTRTSGGSWLTTGIVDEISIPSAVQDLVNARVAALTDNEREILDVAACCGFEFHPLVLAEVVGEAPIALLKTLRRIEQRHRLVRSMGRRFVFDHHQVQESLYVGMPDLLREEYHALIGAALESHVDVSETTEFTGATAVELARHFLRGARGTRALPYLDAALTQLEEGYLNAAVVSLARKALDVPGLIDGRERFELLVRMARRLAIIARRDDERAAIEEALALAIEFEEPEPIARAHMGLAAHYGNTAQYDLALASSERALAIASGARLAELAQGARRYIATIACRTGRYKQSREHFEECLRRSRAEGNRQVECSIENGLGTLDAALGRLDDAAAHHERAYALAQEIQDEVGQAIALGDLGTVSHEVGRLADAQASYTRCLEIFRRSGDRLGEAHALANLGEVEFALGRPADARAHLVDGGGLAAEIGCTPLVAFCDLILGLLADETGEEDRAIELITSAIEQMRADCAPREASNASALVGELLLRRGDEDEARTWIEAALASAEEVGAPNEIGLAAAVAASLPNADVRALTTLVLQHAPAMRVRDRLRAHFALWQATADKHQLNAARRTLEHLVEHAPDDQREAMRTGVRLHRDVVSGRLRNAPGG